VHPYILKNDDVPKFTDKGSSETELFFEKGVGAFSQRFEHGTYQVYDAASIQEKYAE